MKKGIICMVLFISICLSGCSFANSSDNSNSQPELETVIVKETVKVTETVYVTDPNNAEETEQTTMKDNTSEEDENKGYTTRDILKKAAMAADKQYWVVFYEGTRDNKIEMSSFNALEGFSVKWNRSLVCEKQVGKVTQYKFDDDKNAFVEIGSYKILTDAATDIIGSNCDIFDEKNDKTIFTKTE